ncbi:hypothetical protein [Jeotgalibaca porci]|uniref:hypothetical protein n=1 Tax=Jeotgalibaca porci TaxID=1868793 RepID=UPI00359FE4C1
MPTLVEVRDYLGVDWVDEATDRRINGLISVADSFMVGSLGVGYPGDDPRVKELSLIIIGQLYDNTDPIAKVSNSIQKMVDDMSLQIRLEMRGDGIEV